MKASSSQDQDRLFASDETGKVTHLRGIPLPGQLLHTFAVGQFSDRAPMKDAKWVIRGAYDFARRVQGKSPTD